VESIPVANAINLNTHHNTFIVNGINTIRAYHGRNNIPIQITLRASDETVEILIIPYINNTAAQNLAMFLSFFSSAHFFSRLLSRFVIFA
jgi:hypothetical protein